MVKECINYTESAKEGVLKRNKGLSHRYVINRNDYLNRVYYKFDEFERNKLKTGDGVGKVET